MVLTLVVAPGIGVCSVATDPDSAVRPESGSCVATAGPEGARGVNCAIAIAGATIVIRIRFRIISASLICNLRLAEEARPVLSEIFAAPA
jgi:hypothetical protein